MSDNSCATCDNERMQIGPALYSRAMESVACEICGTDDTRPYRVENGYQAVQCQECGLVYVNPRPSIVEMKQLYDGQETKVDLRAHLHGRDLKTVQARACLDLIERYHPPRAQGPARLDAPRRRLLEIGSAAGWFLWEAQKRGYTVQGLDLTHRFVEFSERVLGVPAFEGTLGSAPFAPGSFDVIYLRNVMSHLAYPRAELLTMARLLAPGGHLVLETGNVAELPPESAGELELPDHLHHFSEANLRTLLAAAGLDWVDTHRYVLLDQLPGVRRIKALLERRAKQRTPEPVRDEELHMPASRLARRLVARAVVFGRYGAGSRLPAAGRRCSLVVVAQKPAAAAATASSGPAPRTWRRRTQDQP
jgi:SAM-dependent methyltransferase/ribosomal protein S27E